jgi:MFS family permease
MSTHRTSAASLLAVFAVVVDNTKITVALPALAPALAAQGTTLQWIVESYVLAFAAPLLIGGAIADRWGPGRAMRAGLLAFAAGSVLAAVAPSVGALIGARVVTGLAAALVMPATLAALVGGGRDAPPLGVAAWTGVVALGVAVGPLVGGVLMTTASWPALFWVNVPLALAAVLALPRGAAPASGSAAGRLDVRGNLLLAGAVLGVVAAVTEAPRHAVVVVPAIALALACALAYVRHQRRGDPVVPLDLFRSPGLRVPVGALAAMFAAIFGIGFLVPQYLQIVRGTGPLVAGLYVLGYALALVGGSVVAGAVPPGRRRRLVIGGLLVAAVVHALAAVGLTSLSPAWALAGGLAAIGAGIGLAQTPLTELLLGAVGPRAGLGSALNDAVREVGGVVGVAVLGAVAIAVAGPSLLDGVRVAAAVAAVLLALAAGVTRRADWPVPADDPSAPSDHPTLVTAGATP